MGSPCFETIIVFFWSALTLSFNIYRLIMSFKEYKESVGLGDVVILYINIKNIHAITVSEEIKNKKGNMVPYIFQTVYGALKVTDLVGEYGLFCS